VDNICIVLLGIYSNVSLPKVIKFGWDFTKLYQFNIKNGNVQFYGPPCICTSSPWIVLNTLPRPHWLKTKSIPCKFSVSPSSRVDSESESIPKDGDTENWMNFRNCRWIGMRVCWLSLSRVQEQQPPVGVRGSKALQKLKTLTFWQSILHATLHMH